MMQNISYVQRKISRKSYVAYQMVTMKVTSTVYFTCYPNSCLLGLINSQYKQLNSPTDTKAYLQQEQCSIVKSPDMTGGTISSSSELASNDCCSAAGIKIKQLMT